MTYKPDPGQDIHLTEQELEEEDRRRSRKSLRQLIDEDLADPTTPPPNAPVPLHPEGEEADGR